jgi:hypothetical protein
VLGFAHCCKIDKSLIFVGWVEARNPTISSGLNPTYNPKLLRNLSYSVRFWTDGSRTRTPNRYLKNRVRERAGVRVRGKKVSFCKNTAKLDKKAFYEIINFNPPPFWGDLDLTNPFLEENYDETIPTSIRTSCGHPKNVAY